MANPTATFGNLLDRLARRTHKDRGRADEEADLQHWMEAGIERVEMELPWIHLEEDFTITLVADQYEYDFPNAIGRIDDQYLRYGGSGSHLENLRRPARIDEVLSPSWRDDATASGTPHYFCAFGYKIWIASKPDADFVAANPTVYGYGHHTDLYAISQISDTTDASEVNAVSLRVPLVLRELYILAAMAEGLQQEDDSDWERIDAKYERLVVKYRGDRTVTRADTRPSVPDWAHDMEF